MHRVPKILHALLGHRVRRPTRTASRIVDVQMQRTKTGAHEMTTIRSFVDVRSSVAGDSTPRIRELLKSVRVLARDQPLLETRIAELSSELRMLGHA